MTPASILSVIEIMTVEQKASMRENIGAGNSNDPTVEVISSAAPSIAAEDNHVYVCGTVTSIVISSIPANGEFTVIFTSGSTAATFTEPSGMTMPDNFTVKANTRYEINVSDGYAAVASWAVSVGA